MAIISPSGFHCGYQAYVKMNINASQYVILIWLVQQGETNQTHCMFRKEVKEIDT